MDWAKVKTILIIALVITNAILVFFVYNKNVADIDLNESEKQHAVNRVLKSRGIDNRAAYYLDDFKIPAVNLAYENYDVSKLAKVVLDGNFTQQGALYFNGNYTLSNLNDTLVITSVKTIESESENVYPTLEVAKDIAKSFILDKMHYDNDFVLNKHRVTSQGILLEYGQQYDCYFIDKSFMRILVNSEKVLSYERKWFEVTKNKGEDSIISYSQALFKALDYLEQHSDKIPTTIEEVNLGYVLEDSIFNTDIQFGEGLPFYKFRLSDNSYFLIQALDTMR